MSDGLPKFCNSTSRDYKRNQLMLEKQVLYTFNKDHKNIIHPSRCRFIPAFAHFSYNGHKTQIKLWVNESQKDQEPHTDLCLGRHQWTDKARKPRGLYYIMFRPENVRGFFAFRFNTETDYKSVHEFICCKKRYVSPAFRPIEPGSQPPDLRSPRLTGKRTVFNDIRPHRLQEIEDDALRFLLGQHTDEEKQDSPEWIDRQSCEVEEKELERKDETDDRKILPCLNHTQHRLKICQFISGKKIVTEKDEQMYCQTIPQDVEEIHKVMSFIRRCCAAACSSTSFTMFWGYALSAGETVEEVMQTNLEGNVFGSRMSGLFGIKDFSFGDRMIINEDSHGRPQFFATNLLEFLVECLGNYGLDGEGLAFMHEFNWQRDDVKERKMIRAVELVLKKMKNAFRKRKTKSEDDFVLLTKACYAAIEKEWNETLKELQKTTMYFREEFEPENETKILRYLSDFRDEVVEAWWSVSKRRERMSLEIDVAAVEVEQIPLEHWSKVDASSSDSSRRCPNVTDDCDPWKTCNFARYAKTPISDQGIFDHLDAYDHGPREECPLGETCPQFLRMSEENQFRIDDRCHMKVFCHPPRKQTGYRPEGYVPMQVGIENFRRDSVVCKMRQFSRWYTAFMHEKQRHAHYDYLFFLLIEIIENGEGQRLVNDWDELPPSSQYDRQEHFKAIKRRLCKVLDIRSEDLITLLENSSEIEENMESIDPRHRFLTIMTSVKSKRNHPRWATINENAERQNEDGLKYDEILALILYTRGKLCSDLNRVMLGEERRDSMRWLIFEFILRKAIEKLHFHDEYQKDAPIYSGISDRLLGKSNIERINRTACGTGLFSSFMSLSRSLQTAEKFRGDKGILLRMMPDTQKALFCGDIQWLSDFRSEEEVLVSCETSKWRIEDDAAFIVKKGDDPDSSVTLQFFDIVCV